MDCLVLKKALRAAGRLPTSMAIGVNLSAATLTGVDVSELVEQEVRDSGIAAERLHFELTETSVLRVDDRVTATMAEVAALGVRWWVDDFGTGYSSISHLRDLPITGLKLDRTFTAGITHRDTRNASIALGLAGLAAGLGLDTVAEGVETARQASTLSEQGWQMGQGHLFGAAQDLAAFAVQ
jgi:EAL domain-containing protein (putative c-di-GMP-specific phosphodiesterase class I)